MLSVSLPMELVVLNCWVTEMNETSCLSNKSTICAKSPSDRLNDANSNRLVNHDHGERLDAERRRKRDVILQLIFDEASENRVYTANQFAEAFEGKTGYKCPQNRHGIARRKPQYLDLSRG